ncbi:Uncharacterized conserved protein, DUF1697 family [Aliiroseovarius sediminilitoris]|uniref:Uncharacterized conserved protein, DUF1697 family n=1 Tax=Aliiroseovarius sediminilitoris TaxID=1173584 RepID=A0A1I0MJW3_9RHOB|nr:DUF1697 domain-containing protein [Aliiroseovarius sediminilitoris]SEV88106.1 Uncharacterized conserved protein, DUF1697 family [Aliiroseovarius sediminilitoris]
MKTRVALLRAINVGGTGKLPMTELRSMAEAAGLTDVRTYIQSGNLVFSTADDLPTVKTALEKSLETYAGKPVGVFVRTAQDMQDVLDANPFPNAEPSKVGVLFLDTPPPSKTIEEAKGQADEEIGLGEREVYVHFPSGMGKSRLRLAAMSNGTLRNINTVAKLVKMSRG